MRRYLAVKVIVSFHYFHLQVQFDFDLLDAIELELQSALLESKKLKNTTATMKPLGATLFENGVNIAVLARNAQRIEVCFYEKTGKNLLSTHPLPLKSGDVFYGFFEGEFKEKVYGIRVYGDNQQNSGNRFNPNKLLIDPYALEINERIELHPSMFDNNDDSAQYVAKAKIITPQIVCPKPNQNQPSSCDIIYELNVRGFTALKTDIPKQIRGTFAGLGHENSVKYLKELGVNIVELLPCAAWIDERHLPALGLNNYWGYNPIAFMAPDPRLAPNGWAEVSACVINLENAGIKTIIDVVFNHSGESDKHGPIVSLRGIDNQTYYRLCDDDKSEYINDAGTGNILDADNPSVIALVIDSLKAWHNYGGVHGFRFDLATVLGRTKFGFDADNALLSAIKSDEVLSKLILIAEPWDCGPGGYQLGAFPNNWPEWNDKYRDCIRRSWLGGGVSLGEFATRFCGSQDIFHGSSPAKSVNYISAHDGFTLNDLVSYSHKNNFANGEENRDGTDNNISFNHGTEGPTDDPHILAERGKSQRALLATLLMSRGIPMLSMGAEHGKSQNGNNNAYPQDNEIGYLNWESHDKDLLIFTKKLISIRQKHLAICNQEFLTGQSNVFQDYKDVDWRRPDNLQMSHEDWSNTEKTRLCIILTNDRLCKDRVSILINWADSDIDFCVPKARDNSVWKLILDTSEKTGGKETKINGATYKVKARSISIMTEEVSNTARLLDADDQLITQLSEALGIESKWTDVNGKVTIVPRDTKIRLIEAMGYDCKTDCQTLASLKSFSDKYFRRPIEFARCVTEGEEIHLKLYCQNIGNIAFNIETEDARLSEIIGIWQSNFKSNSPDGQICEYSIYKIPYLSVGRYKIWRDEHPNSICRLTVAPKYGYLPEILETNTLAGLSSQIYALKRPGDQGIGDFTSLAQVMDHCVKLDLDILGINPLHALFPADKNLASPYYPSDRIALEPHYIDLRQLDALADLSEFADRNCVDYQQMWNFKSEQLEKYYRTNKVKIASDAGFEDFKNNLDPPIRQFAIFQAISEKYPRRQWREWPDDLAKRDIDALNKFANQNAERIDYHQYLQYLCDQQLKSAAEIGAKMRIGICRDLAIGTSPDGAESWAIQSKVAKNVSIGAPPDLLGPRGQVWGLPPLNPHQMIENGFKSVIGLYKANMKHAGALRIDHAMGIMRQFWVPEGASAADGAYVRFPFENILGELKLESHRAKCVIIGEDLGTVPEGFSETMNAANALSYKVLQFEKNAEAFKSPEEYPKACFACISTHDLAPIKGWWKGIDIDERRTLGLYTKEEAQKCETDRLLEKEELLAALKRYNLIDDNIAPDAVISKEIVAAIHAYIALSPSYLAIAQIEDLAGEIVPINLPGTDKERPNWRNCVSLSIDEIFGNLDAKSWSNTIIAALRMRTRQN